MSNPNDIELTIPNLIYLLTGPLIQLSDWAFDEDYLFQLLGALALKDDTY